MHRARGVVWVVAVAVVLTAMSGTTASGSVGAGGDAWRSLQSSGTDIDPDRVVIEVELRPDGSARWRVRYRVQLDNQSVADAFAAVADDIETNRLEHAGRFKLRTEPVVAAAANETGREMELREVTVTTDRRQPPGAASRYGVVGYEFVWTNFAVVDDGRIRMGDALVGFFLTEDATMLVTWPDGYRAVESSPTPDENREGTAVWTGPKEFTADGPRMVVESTGSPTSVLPVAPAWVAAALLLTVLLAAGWYRTRGSESSTASTAPPVAVDTDSTAPDETTPEELLSDEERVVRLLENNGGRMKQQEVVEALEWSETKTSQVVTDLHEAGKIERYRLGRENVLALPGEIDV